MPRTYHYAESLSRATTTTTDFSAVAVGLTFTPKANTTYAIFWNVTTDCDSIYSPVKLRLYNTTESTEMLLRYWAATRTNEYHPLGGFAFYTSGASPVSTTFQLQYGMVSANTAGVTDATLCAIELTANDRYEESSADATNTTTTYQNKATLSWTPASTADYLVCATARLSTSDGGGGPKIRVNYNSGTYYAEADPYDYGGSSTSNRLPYFFMKQGASLSGSQSFAIEFGLAWGTATITCSDVRILALYMPDFYGYLWDEERTDNNSTSATYATSGVSITSTPAAQVYWILAGGLVTSDDTTRTVLESNIVRRNATSLYTNAPAQCSYSGNEHPWVFSRVATESATSTTWDHQYASLSGTGTATTKDNVLAVIKLTDVSTSTAAIPPDSIAASTNLSGAYTDIDDDPDSPDGAWLTATTTDAATDLRATFGAPSGVPDGTQNFKLWLRATAAVSPTVDVQLYQNGSSVASLVTGHAITSTSGQLVQADWNASQLSGTLDGSDVECRVVSTPVSGGGLPTYSSSGTSNSSTAIGTKSINVPTHSAGDLLLLVVYARNSAANAVVTSITTSGWTQLGGAGNMYGGTQLGRFAVGWKIGDGSGTTVSFTMSGGGIGVRVLSRVHRFTSSGAGFATTPIDNISSVNTGSSTSVTMPTVSPSGTNQLAVALVGSSAASTVAPATGESGGDWTEPIAEVSATNGVSQIQHSDQSGGGTISGGTTTLGTTGQWVSLGFTLIPVTGGTVEVGAVEWNAQYITSTGNSIPAAAYGVHGIAPSVTYRLSIPTASVAIARGTPALRARVPVPPASFAPHAVAPSLTQRYAAPTKAFAVSGVAPAAAYRYTSPVALATAHAFAPTATARVPVPVEALSFARFAPSIGPRNLAVPTLAATVQRSAPSLRYLASVPTEPFAVSRYAPTLKSLTAIPTEHAVFQARTPSRGALSIDVPTATGTVQGRVPAIGQQVPRASVSFVARAPGASATQIEVPAASVAPHAITPSLRYRAQIPAAHVAPVARTPALVLRASAPAGSVAVHPTAPSLRARVAIPTRGLSVHASAPAQGAQIGSLHLSFSASAPVVGLGSVAIPPVTFAATARTPAIGQQLSRATLTATRYAPTIGPRQVLISAATATVSPQVPSVPPPPDVTPTASVFAVAVAPLIGPQRIAVPRASASGLASAPGAAFHYTALPAAVAVTPYAPVARYLAHVGTRGIRVSLATPSALVTEPEYSFPPYVVRANSVIAIDAPRRPIDVQGFTIAIDEI